MKKLIDIKNILLLLIAVIALVMAIRPFGGMSTSLEVVSACILLAVGALLGLIAIRDKPRDEREQLLAIYSDRAGFIVGVIAAAALVLHGSLTDASNRQLEATLALMVIAKLAVNFYQNRQ